MRRVFLTSALCSVTMLGLAQPYAVGHISRTYTDPDRGGRSVSCEVYYPASSAGDNQPFASIAGNVPIIAMGHGFVMTYDAYANIYEAVAAHGYVIALPTTEGSLSPSHGTFAEDLKYTLKAIKEQENTLASSPLYNRVDTMSCLMGHSMGGGAATLAASDVSGVHGLVTFAAAETSPSAISASANVRIPSLLFVGNNDCVTPPATNQQPMYDAIVASCKHYINITGGSHCQMAGNSITCTFGEASCTPAPAISRSAQHVIISKYLLPWLDYTLKKNCTAGTSFESMSATDAAISVSKNCTLCSGTSVASTPKADVMNVLLLGNRKVKIEMLGIDNVVVQLHNTLGHNVYIKEHKGSDIMDLGAYSAGMYILSARDILSGAIQYQRLYLE